jgi:hypothetical protein
MQTAKKEQQGRVKPFSINPKSFRESTRGDLLQREFARSVTLMEWMAKWCARRRHVRTWRLTFPRPQDSFGEADCDPAGQKKGWTL